MQRRFISQDSYKGSAYAPWTQNLYTYTGNNPVNFVDPTGHYTQEPYSYGDDYWDTAFPEITPTPETSSGQGSGNSGSGSSSSGGGNPVIIPEDGGTWVPEDNGVSTPGSFTTIESVKFISKSDLLEMYDSKQEVEDFMDWIGTPRGQGTVALALFLLSLVTPVPGAKAKAGATLVKALKALKVVVGAGGAYTGGYIAAAYGDIGQMDERDFNEQMALCYDGDFVVEITTVYVMHYMNGPQIVRQKDYDIAYNGVWNAPDGITGDFIDND